MFIYKSHQEGAVHLSQHSAFLKPFPYFALSNFRTFLLSPRSTNKYELFYWATYMNPTTAVPRWMVWYFVSKGDHHQTLLIKKPRKGIITRCKQDFLRNFHQLGQWFPAFSQGCHSQLCSPMAPIAAFPSLPSHFPTLTTLWLHCYFPSWCFQPKAHVEDGVSLKIHRSCSWTHRSHKLHRGFWAPAQPVASARSYSTELHCIIMQHKQKSSCQF